MDKFISVLLSTKSCLEMGLSGMNVSPTPCFINGRGASQQKHIVSCATICVYFSLHVFVCDQMCVHAHERLFLSCAVFFGSLSSGNRVQSG